MLQHFDRIFRTFAIVIFAGAVSGVAAVTGPAGAAELNWKPLTLLHGWANVTGSNVGAAQVAIDPNTSLIYLRGGLDGAASTSMVPFKLPPLYRSTRLVYVPVSLLQGKPGRLIIDTTGFVTIQAPPGISTDNDAKTFTSVEGVVFSR